MVLVPTPVSIPPAAAAPLFDFWCAWPKAAPPLPEPRAEHNIVVWWMISVDCCLRERVLNQGDCDVAAHGGGASAVISNESYILVFFDPCEWFCFAFFGCCDSPRQLCDNSESLSSKRRLAAPKDARCETPPLQNAA